MGERAPASSSIMRLPTLDFSFSGFATYNAVSKNPRFLSQKEFVAIPVASFVMAAASKRCQCYLFRVFPVDDAAAGPAVIYSLLFSHAFFHSQSLLCTRCGREKDRNRSEQLSFMVSYESTMILRLIVTRNESTLKWNSV